MLTYCEVFKDKEKIECGAHDYALITIISSYVRIKGT